MFSFLSYLFYFIAATASPLQRRWLATKKNPENSGQIHFAFQVTIIVSILGLLLPLFKPFHLTGNPLHLISIALVCGISGAFVYIANYIAQKHIEAGITTIVMNIYTPITIVLATFLLNEKLSSMQILGTVLLLIGMVIVSKKHHLGKFKFDKYFLMMIFSGVMLGISLTAEKALMNITGFSAGTLFSWWSQCLFLGIATLITKNRSTYSKKDITITGGLRFLQSLSWVILLLVVGNLSIISSVTTFKVVLIFIGGAIFLNERDDIKRKIFGSIIAVAGLLLMK
ncbi:MAG: EamA family transporter [Candidatus Moranbacteria bacterium]|nr:EamA family transporter [Candidatus Moranbacteria bacterium]